MLKNPYNFYILLIFNLGLLFGFMFMDVDSYKNLKYLNTEANNYSFFKVFSNIFITNCFVGLLLSIFGYFTASIITIIVIFGNSVILSFYLKAIYFLDANIWFKIKLFVVHGPIEILAFYYLAMIGFKGIIFYKSLYQYNNFSMKISITKEEFYIPIILLLIAALAESIIIVNL